MPENGPISLTRGNLAFDFPIWKIKAARWSAAQTRQGWQRVAERFFSALLRVPLRLCVKPGLAPREKRLPSRRRERMLAPRVVRWETRNEQPDIADTARTSRAGDPAHPRSEGES